MEIQTAVHKIYQQLSVTLERALQANKHHIGNPNFCFIKRDISSFLLMLMNMK